MARTTAAYAHTIADGEQDSDTRGDAHFHSNANGDRDTHGDLDLHTLANGHGRRFAVAHCFPHAHGHTIAYVHGAGHRVAHGQRNAHALSHGQRYAHGEPFADGHVGGDGDAEPNAVAHWDEHSFSHGHTIGHGIGCVLAYSHEPRDSLGDRYHERYAVCDPGHDPYGQPHALAHSPWEAVAGESQL